MQTKPLNKRFCYFMWRKEVFGLKIRIFAGNIHVVDFSYSFFIHVINTLTAYNRSRFVSSLPAGM